MPSSSSIAFPPRIVKDETIQHLAFVWRTSDSPTIAYETFPNHTLPGSNEPCGIPSARRLKLNLEIMNGGTKYLNKMLTFRPRDQGFNLDIAFKSNKRNNEQDWAAMTLAEVVATGVLVRQRQTTPFRYQHIKHFTWGERKCYFIKSVISSSYDNNGIFRQHITQHFYKTEVPGSFPVGDSRIVISSGHGVVIHDTPDDAGVGLSLTSSGHDFARDMDRMRAWKTSISLTMVVHEHTNIFVNGKLFADMEHHRTPLLPLMTMKMMKVCEIEDEVYDKTSYPQQQRILRANLMRDVIEKALHPDLVARRVEQYGLDWIDLINP